MRRRRRTPLGALYLAALGAVAITACGSNEPLSPIELPVTVSGPLTNRTGQPIPAGARVVVLWGVSATSPDYSYVYGEGTVDRTTNRFTITFDGNVPSEALNNNALGVGLVLLTTDPNLGEGRVPDSYTFSPTNTLGVTGQYAVIYVNGDPSALSVDWARAFRRGYNVGRGVDLPGSFDGFAPTGLTSMELIVDDLGSIEVVNWT
jgi:hypothetical protein